MTEENKRKYCRYCGSKLETIQGDYYDENTGKNIPILVCSNINCKEGCYYHGGHQPNFWTGICKRCGTMLWPY